jgi:hypothetical protein
LPWFREIKDAFLRNYSSLVSFSEKSKTSISSLRFATINTNQNSIAKGAEASKNPRIMYHMLDLSFGNSVQQSKSSRLLQNTCIYDNQQTSEGN